MQPRGDIESCISRALEMDSLKQKKQKKRIHLRVWTFLQIILDFIFSEKANESIRKKFDRINQKKTFWNHKRNFCKLQSNQIQSERENVRFIVRWLTPFNVHYNLLFDL